MVCPHHAHETLMVCPHHANEKFVGKVVGGGGKQGQWRSMSVVI